MIKISTEQKTDSKTLKILTMNKAQYEMADFTNTGFENKKFQMAVLDDILYISTTGIKTKDDWRDLGYKLTKKINALNVKHARMTIPLTSQEFLEGILLAEYSFRKYKSNLTKVKECALHLTSTEGNLKDVITEVKARVKAQFITRDWVNTSPEDAQSVSIEKYVQKRFKNDKNISVEVYDEKALKK